MVRRPVRCLLLVLFFVFFVQSIWADDAVEFRRDVEFSNPNGEHLTLDLSRPKSTEGLSPSVVCIHGGGWAKGNKAPWDAFCRTLARHGYTAVSVSYRLAPKYRFPAQLDDARAAVRWLRENADRLKVDPKRIGTIGDSAGGHLAMMLGTTGDEADFDTIEHADLSQTARQGKEAMPRISSRVQCVVDFYGPSDLTRTDKVLPVVEQLVTDFVGSDLEHRRRQHAAREPD